MSTPRLPKQRPNLIVHVIGEERGARILPEAPYDPKGEKLRA